LFSVLRPSDRPCSYFFQLTHSRSKLMFQCHFVGRRLIAKTYWKLILNDRMLLQGKRISNIPSTRPSRQRANEHLESYSTQWLFCGDQIRLTTGVDIKVEIITALLPRSSYCKCHSLLLFGKSYTLSLATPSVNNIGKSFFVGKWISVLYQRIVQH
jgi:hypothetical protein